MHTLDFLFFQVSPFEKKQTKKHQKTQTFLYFHKMRLMHFQGDTTFADGLN